MMKSTARITATVHAEDREFEGVACEAHTNRLDIERGNAVSEVPRCLMEVTESESHKFQFHGSSPEGVLKFAGCAGPAIAHHPISGLAHSLSMNDASPGSRSSYIYESPDQLTQGSGENIAYRALDLARSEKRISSRARAPQIRDISNTSDRTSFEMMKSTARITATVHAEDREFEGVAWENPVSEVPPSRCLMEVTESESHKFQFHGSSPEGVLKFAGCAGPAIAHHPISGLAHSLSMNDASPGSRSSYIYESPDQLTQGSGENITYRALDLARSENRISSTARAPQIRDISNTSGRTCLRAQMKKPVTAAVHAEDQGLESVAGQELSLKCGISLPSSRSSSRESDNEIEKERPLIEDLKADHAARAGLESDGVLEQLRQALETERKERLKAQREAEIERQGRLRAEFAEKKAKQEAELAKQEAELAKQEAELAKQAEEQAKQRLLKAEEELKNWKMPPTKGQLLDSRLPLAIDMSSMKKSSSHAVNRRIPAGVKSTSIINEVVEFRRNLDPEFLSEPAIPLHESAQPEGYFADDEKALDGVYMHIIAPAVNGLTKHKNIRTSDVKTCGVNLGQGLSTADHVSTYTIDEICRVLVPMEMKRRNFNQGHRCIVAQYKDKITTIVDGIWQTCGHLYDNDSEFAIITTYHSLWVLRLDELGWVHISEEFSSETEGPASILNVLFWLLNKAHQRKMDTSSTWKCPFLVSVEDVQGNQASQTGARGEAAAGSSAKTGQRGNVLTQHNSDSSSNPSKRSCAPDGDGKILGKHKDFSFFIYGVLQERPNCQTLKAQLKETGTDVVIKCFFHEHDRENEEKCYVAAKELQGKIIPEMIGKCLMSETRRCRHALVLSFSPGGNYDMLPTEVYYKVKDCIARLHRCGVAHGDIDARNMSYSFVTGSLFLYDFSNGRTCEGPGASKEDKDAFAMVCTKDMQDLEDLIEESQTDQARAWQYAVVP